MDDTEQGGSWTRWWRRRVSLTTGRRARERSAWSLYRAAVERARTPEFYRVLGAPDTPDGRFELLAIHVALICRRLCALGSDGAELARALMEVMVQDMDRSVRELGVGDLSVGRYVTKLMASLRARIETLDRAIATDDSDSIVRMLDRNLFHAEARPPEEVVDRLVAHVRGFARDLDMSSGSELMQGQLPAAAIAKRDEA